MMKPEEMEKRDGMVVAMRGQGMTFQAIGNAFGFSRQRAQQIYRRLKGHTHHEIRTKFAHLLMTEVLRKGDRVVFNGPHKRYKTATVVGYSREGLLIRVLLDGAKSVSSFSRLCWVKSDGNEKGPSGS